MQLGKLRLEGPWGNTALLLVFIGFSLWYLHDAHRASSNVQNLLLIGPASGVAVAAGLWLLARDLRHLRIRRIDPTPDPRTLRDRYGPLAAMTALVLYAVAMPYVGFDVATFAFIATGMWIQGERRVAVLIGFPALVTVAVIYALQNVLFTPVPTMWMG